MSNDNERLQAQVSQRNFDLTTMAVYLKSQHCQKIAEDVLKANALINDLYTALQEAEADKVHHEYPPDDRWCDGGCAPDECVCVSNKLLKAYYKSEAALQLSQEKNTEALDALKAILWGCGIDDPCKLAKVALAKIEAMKESSGPS